MASYFTVNLNSRRSGLSSMSEESRSAEARKRVKDLLVPQESTTAVSEDMVPNHLVSDLMVKRFLEISPPVAAVIPEFLPIIEEIERAYVLGMLFSAVSASCVTIERLLNLARIKLHKHHSRIKKLWDKGPSNEWCENIDALHAWGYIDDDLAEKLRAIYKNIRCKYVHSGSIEDLPNDALRSVQAAYKLLTIFLGFPEPLSRLTNPIECLNPGDPRFIEFYLPNLHSGKEG